MPVLLLLQITLGTFLDVLRKTTVEISALLQNLIIVADCLGRVNIMAFFYLICPVTQTRIETKRFLSETVSCKKLG